MAKSVLLIGLGRFGYHMAERMQELKDEVLGVDIDEDKVEQCLSCLTSAQIADANDENFIRTLGVRNFDVCVVAIGDNFQASLEVTALLKDLAPSCGVPCGGEIHAKFLLRNGSGPGDLSERIWPAMLPSNTPPPRAGLLPADAGVRHLRSGAQGVDGQKALRELLGPPQAPCEYSGWSGWGGGGPGGESCLPVYRSGESIFILGASKEVKPFL